jgi:hypothetical protein
MPFGIREANYSPVRMRLAVAAGVVGGAVLWFVLVPSDDPQSADPRIGVYWWLMIGASLLLGLALGTGYGGMAAAAAGSTQFVLAIFTAPRGDNDGLWILWLPGTLVATLLYMVVAEIGGWFRTDVGPSMGGSVDHGDEEDLSPDEYEAATGVSPSEWERRALESMKRALAAEWVRRDRTGREIARGSGIDGVEIEHVAFEGQPPDTEAVVLFRADRRPGCLYGWRFHIWPVPPPDDEEMGTPESWGSVMRLNLEELVLAAPGLPECRPDQTVTWA